MVLRVNAESGMGMVLCLGNILLDGEPVQEFLSLVSSRKSIHSLELDETVVKCTYLIWSFPPTLLRNRGCIILPTIQMYVPPA